MYRSLGLCVSAFIVLWGLSVPALAQADQLTADQAIADLDRLYEGLQSADAGLFAATSRDAFDEQYATLRESYDGPVTLAQLHRDFQRFAVMARHSHTRIEGLNPAWADFVHPDALVFPLTFHVTGEEVIVTGAPAGSSIVPGDRILSLEGDANDVWLARLTRNIAADTASFAYAQMEGGELYYIWLEYGERTQFTLEIRRDGAAQEVTIDAIPLAAYGGFQTLEPGFSLEGREARMLSDHVAYLRPGAFSNLDAERPEDSYAPDALADYVAFIDGAFEDFIARDVQHLVLDLRDNPGGDVSFSDPVVAWFADRPFRFASDFRILISPETTASNAARLDGASEGDDSISARYAALYATAEPGEVVSFDLPFVEPREGTRFTGEVHVLVNRRSYSNAVTTAALIQDYGFGTIYGEPTRDMATTYGAMEHFTLPHTGFSVGYPKALIIRPDGTETPAPVMPDVPLPVPAVRGPDDVALELLLDRLSED